MTSVASITKTNSLSGSTWPVTIPTVSTEQTLVILLAAMNKTITPATPSGYSSRAGSGAATSNLYGAIFSQKFTAASSATILNIVWSAAQEGAAYAVLMSDADWDAISAMYDSSTFASTATMPNVTAAASNSIRLEFVATEYNRTMTNAVLTDETQSTYGSIASGGIGSGAGYKAASAGVTTGDPWTFVDPDGGSETSPAIGWAMIFKPLSGGAANPTISGYAYLPEDNAAAAPATPSAPTVTVTNSDTIALTASGLDGTADTLHVNAAVVAAGVPGSYSVIHQQSLTGISYPLSITGLFPGTTYRFSIHVSRTGQPSANVSAYVEVITKRLVAYLYTDPTALGVAGVDAQVFRSPAAGYLAGETLIAVTNKTFDAALSSGFARLEIPFTAQPTTGAKLRHGNTVSAVARKALGAGLEIWTRITPDATIGEVT